MTSSTPAPGPAAVPGAEFHAALPELRTVSDALYGALSQPMNQSDPYAEIAWQLAKALAFLLNAADRSGDHAALMEGLGQVSDSTATAAARARALLAAGVPVLTLAADRAADRENRTALGDSLTTRVTAELLTADEHGDSYGGPRDLLDVELTGDSIAVKSELHGTLATDARPVGLGRRAAGPRRRLRPRHHACA
ncbi:hypothetical protein [Nonomuraea sp. NPDC005692]|uniref:hypothetical protein n=1 Tax=Nonomuraea sp. NPDC005692 TaxID=3157168 RepID=UPI0033F0A498